MTKVTYTAFCKEAGCAFGTTWIDVIEVDPDLPIEEVIKAARQTCAEVWGIDVEFITCIGIAEGNIQLLYWED